MNPPRKETSPLQYASATIAMFSSGVALLLIILWMHGTDTAQGYLGGIDWEKNTFQWHPIMMTAGLIFSFTWAALAFRVFAFGKPINKLLHSITHSASVVCLSIGLYAVFTGNNDPSKNPSDTYYTNLATLHSWIGIGTVSLYLFNYVCGILIFLGPWASVELRKGYLNLHVPLGILLVILAAIAAETGIMELATEVAGCGSYALSGPDTNPAAHYSEFTAGCKLANGAGLLVLVTAMTAIYALLDPKTVGAVGPSLTDTEREPLFKA